MAAWRSLEDSSAIQDFSRSCWLDRSARRPALKVSPAPTVATMEVFTAGTESLWPRVWPVAPPSSFVTMTRLVPRSRRMCRATSYSEDRFP